MTTAMRCSSAVTWHIPETMSEAVAGEIDAEVKTIITDCYAKAKKLIEENIDVLHACAGLLLEKERISQR